MKGDTVMLGDVDFHFPIPIMLYILLSWDTKLVKSKSVSRLLELYIAPMAVCCRALVLARNHRKSMLRNVAYIAPCLL